jgi:CBS domain-containing protein
MDMAGTGRRVRIYIGEQDKAPGSRQPAWEAILDLLRKEGAAGATMFRGLAGFGAHGRLHLARLADILPDLPVVVEWIDGPERIERLLPRIGALVASGTITIEDIGIVKYTHREPRSLPTARVDEIMTRDVVAVHPDTPVGELVRILLERDLRSVPVVDDDRLVGIVTNRDLVERAGLSARVELLAALGGAALERELAGSPARVRTAGDVMTRDVVRVSPDESLERAAHTMAEHRIKRLPVVDAGGRLVGIISRVDVLRTMGEAYHAPVGGHPPPVGPVRVVGDLARRDVPTVRADAPLGEVLDAVTSTRLNRAIVVDADRRVLGIISDADLLERLDPAGKTGLLGALMGRGKPAFESRATARDVMRSPALAVTADMPVAEAADHMLAARRKVLPITDPDGRLVGAVDRADLLGYLSATTDAAPASGG